MGVQYLKQVKKEKKLSHEKISDISGVPISTVRRIFTESSGEKTSFASVTAVCNALGIDVALYAVSDEQIEKALKEKELREQSEKMSSELLEYDVVCLYRDLDPMGKALVSRYMHDLIEMQKAAQ